MCLPERFEEFCNMLILIGFRYKCIYHLLLHDGDFRFQIAWSPRPPDSAECCPIPYDYFPGILRVLRDVIRERKALSVRWLAYELRAGQGLDQTNAGVSSAAQHRVCLFHSYHHHTVYKHRHPRTL